MKRYRPLVCLAVCLLCWGLVGPIAGEIWRASAAGGSPAVMAAMQRLAEDGLITRRPGRGSFVAVPLAHRRANRLMTFTQEMRRAGRVVAEMHAKTRDAIKPGVTTMQLNNIAAEVIAKRGADPTAVIARVKQVIESHRKEMPGMSRLGVLYDRSVIALVGAAMLLQILALPILWWLTRMKPGLGEPG